MTTTTTAESGDTNQADENLQLDENQNNEAAGEENKDLDSESNESNDSNSGEEQSNTGEENQGDDDLESWAKEKNLPLDDPLKLAKMYRDAEKKMHKDGEQVAELRKQVEKQAGEDADEGESQEETQTRTLLNKLAVTDFYLNNPEARRYDEKMAEILKSKPYLGNDLETLYVIAKATTSDEQLLEARKQGEKSARKAANQSERQGSPSVQARGNQSSEKEDPIMKGLMS